MDGSYAESSVKRQNNVKIMLYKALIILADVLLLGIWAFTGFGFVFFLFVAGVVATIFVMPLFKVEYEVIFVNGQLDFARILNGSMRKRLLRMDFDNAEIMAPENSHELDNFKNNSKISVKSFVSGLPEAKNYAIVGKDDKGKMVMAFFEPSEKMLGLIKGNPTFRRKFSEY